MLSGFTKTDVSRSSEIDKKLIFDKSRYIIGRYIGTIQLVIAGFGAIGLGMILYFSH